MPGPYIFAGTSAIISRSEKFVFPPSDDPIRRSGLRHDRRDALLCMYTSRTQVSVLAGTA